MASPHRQLRVHPLLQPYVREIFVDEGGVEPGPTPYRVLPGPAPVIGFQYCGRLSVRRDGTLQRLGRSGITGIQSTARWFVPEVETRSVLVRLAPFGAYALLNQSMAELADRHVALDQVVSGMRSMEERVRELGSAEAAEHVQHWLLERIAERKRYVHPDVLAATRLIAASAGRERVEVVADAIGVGRRRLERLFNLQVGVGPKELASLVRFDRAARQLGRKSWIGIALDAGYADQAHFIRDFRRRTGTTPTEFQRTPDS